MYLVPKANYNQQTEASWAMQSLEVDLLGHGGEECGLGVCERGEQASGAGLPLQEKGRIPRVREAKSQLPARWAPEGLSGRALANQ